jgi:transcriptional regulator with XRE-family HTH domain
MDLSQTKFAKEIGVSSQLICKIETGKANLTEQNIHLICFTFGVNEKWLREGIGEMLNVKEELSIYERRLLDLFEKWHTRARQSVSTEWSERSYHKL